MMRGVLGEGLGVWIDGGFEFHASRTLPQQLENTSAQPLLDPSTVLETGVEIAATVTGLHAEVPADPDAHWLLGAVDLGPAQQAADVLTWAHTSDEIHEIVVGPLEEVSVLASFGARP